MFSKQKPQETKPELCLVCVARSDEVHFLRSRLTALEDALKAKSDAEAAHVRIVTDIAKQQMQRDAKDNLADEHWSPVVEDIKSPFGFVVEGGN